MINPRTRTLIAQGVPRGKRERMRVAQHRKITMAKCGRVYRDLARVGKVSYSMVDKYVNARRASVRLDVAFRTLTGHDPYPVEATEGAASLAAAR